MSDLANAQFKFSGMLGNFLCWIYAIPGYTVTLGEAYRTQEQADWYAKNGEGIQHSLHTERLAIDLNLFVNGQLQTTTSAYLDLGIRWEAMGGSWGGRFTKPDADHFSLSFGGVK